ncbi:MAG: hypothetical protein A2X36_14715 [Elusimicrobia bacterium GWA2_69_24]|nr:MAG: hypothetical protein A2X36_14715 [Elusimicrobia bacterium GWA2_69_24]HBL17633.1 hypothetical protein [Elusimicrobiota bacterium]
MEDSPLRKTRSAFLLAAVLAFAPLLPARAQVIEVPVLNPQVGAGLGSAGAGLNGSGGLTQKDLNAGLSAPTLDGNHLPSALNPTPLTLPKGAGVGAATLEQPAAAGNVLPAAGSVLPAGGKKAAVLDLRKEDPAAPKLGTPGARQGLSQAGRDSGELGGDGSHETDRDSEGETAVGAAIFDGKVSPAEPEAVVPEVDSARVDRAATAVIRYMRSIMGSQAPTAKQRRSLFELAMEDNGISLDSPLGQAVEAKFYPDQAAARQSRLLGLQPEFQRYGNLILSLADEYGTTTQRIEALAREQKLIGLLANTQSKDTFESVVRRLLDRDRMGRVVSRYPRTAQGEFLRSLGDAILTKSGKSVEEIGRPGAFAYVDFSGLQVTKTSVGRDPDNQSPNMVFYIELEPGGKWKIGGYRQNSRRGNFRGGSDASYIQALKEWLTAGGVPAADLR